MDKSRSAGGQQSDGLARWLEVMAVWVLVIIALNGPMIFTIPGYSSEQTCSAHAKDAIAKLPHLKSGIRWTYRCIRPD
jgi:hypothetical protein